MKDSREYTKKVQKLYRKLKRKSARAGVVKYEEPVDALVYAVISENMTESQTQAAIRRLREYFVDWNDLRVAIVDEISETLGPDVAQARNIATTLVSLLGAVFQRYNMLSLQSLKKLGKRPAKQLLERLNAITPFVVDYCMLTALDGHAIPLTPRMMEYLKAGELVHAEAGYEDVEGFLTRQISVKNAYEFYALLRRESESSKTRKTSKSKSAKARQ